MFPFEYNLDALFVLNVDEFVKFKIYLEWKVRDGLAAASMYVGVFIYSKLLLIKIYFILTEK